MKQPQPTTPNTLSDVVLGTMGSFAGRFVHSFVLVFLGCLVWWGVRSAYSAITAAPAGAAHDEPTALTGIIPPRPPHYEPVTDAAALLRPEEADTLRARLNRFERATATQIVLVTIPTLGNEGLEDVAQRLYTNWGIGQRGADNGVLLLVARREHEIRIQTGYGLEGVIPDATAFRIIEDVLQPAFRQERYFVGLDAATTQLMRLARGEKASFARPARLSSVGETIPFSTAAYWFLGIWGFLLLRQCWQQGGISGLWAWKKSKWWTEGRQRAAAHNRRSSGGKSRAPRRNSGRDDDDRDRDSRNSRDSSGSSGSSSSSSDSSSSSSDWGGGSSGGGGASGGW